MRNKKNYPFIIIKYSVLSRALNNPMKIPVNLLYRAMIVSQRQFFEGLQYGFSKNVTNRIYLIIVYMFKEASNSE